jgi:hypothetical protein
MTKKLSLLLTIVAALAFAAPSTAMAAESRLTDSGSPLWFGSTVYLTGSAVVFDSNLLGFIGCKRLTLRGWVTKNLPNNVELAEENLLPPAEDCTNGTKVVTVTKVNLESLRSTESGKVTATFTATLDVASLECTFKGTSVPGTYTSGTSVLQLNLGAKEIVGTPAGSCGKASLEATFFLETENHVPVVFD